MGLDNILNYLQGRLVSLSEGKEDIFDLGFVVRDGYVGRGPIPRVVLAVFEVDSVVGGGGG